jgi:hypothetical protein
VACNVLAKGTAELTVGEVGGGGRGQRDVAKLKEVEVLLYVLRKLHPT